MARVAHSPRFERLSSRQWLTLVVLTVSTFVALLDASVVNVALPVIVRDLGGSLDAATWVLTGFVLAFAVLLPSSKLADLLVLASSAPSSASP